MEQCNEGGGGREQGIRHLNIHHKNGKRIIKKKTKLLLLWPKKKIKHVKTIVFLIKRR